MFKPERCSFDIVTAIGDIMKKQFIALTAAILITLVVGTAMLAIGGAALFN